MLLGSYGNPSTGSKDISGLYTLTNLDSFLLHHRGKTDKNLLCCQGWVLEVTKTFINKNNFNVTMIDDGVYIIL